LTAARFRITRAGAILGVADFAKSLTFYRDQLGLDVVAVYEDPPYATLSAAGARISLAEQGHPAPDRPGVTIFAPADRSNMNVVLVLEVDDAHEAHRELEGRGVPILAPIYSPPWGGSRFFCVDPDGYLVEIEEPG
jgi:catechol 2,3-dioxygenase-like lactoylglutathione lyase family enzyme